MFEISINTNEMTSRVNYIASLFEFFAGFNMITNPGALLNGYTPRAGYETLAFEWFGCCCIVWGILLARYGTESNIVGMNVLYQGLWVVSLGSSFFGMPWRPESAVSDGSWAAVPLGAHTLFFVLNLVSMFSSSEKAKSS